MTDQAIVYDVRERTGNPGHASVDTDLLWYKAAIAVLLLLLLLLVVTGFWLR